MFDVFISSVNNMFSLEGMQSKSALQIAGDVLQYMPIFVLIFCICKRDKKSFIELLISTLVNFIIMRAIKHIFLYIATNINEAYAMISQRPDTKDFDGFPSGHTSACFVAAGFVCKKYGFLYSIPFILIGILVGFSRVYAQRHTIIQVCAGAILGFFISYIITSRQLKAIKTATIGIHGITSHKK